jgi:hypothetical protein
MSGRQGSAKHIYQNQREWSRRTMKNNPYPLNTVPQISNLKEFEKITGKVKMDNNLCNWLLATAATPICYNLTHEYTDALLENAEVATWFARLAERSNSNEIGAIHGSHDYSMENILGKCWILGLNRKIATFDESVGFILEYLNRHIQEPPTGKPGFGRLYHYRDCEKVLACFMPLLGYYDNPAVKCVTRQRYPLSVKYSALE